MKTTPTFDIAKFWRFCAALRVDTKDRGLISLAWDDLFGCQKYFVEQIAIGLSEGIHSFIVLKGRQQGITTWDPYYALCYQCYQRSVTRARTAHQQPDRAAIAARRPRKTLALETGLMPAP